MNLPFNSKLVCLFFPKLSPLPTRCCGILLSTALFRGCAPGLDPAGNYTPQTLLRSKQLRPTSDSPQTHHRLTSDPSQTHLRPITDSPQTHHRPTSDPPQTHLRHNPQTHLRSTTDQPQTHHRPTSDPSQTHLRPLSDSPGAVPLDPAGNYTPQTLLRSKQLRPTS